MCSGLYVPLLSAVRAAVERCTHKLSCGCNLAKNVINRNCIKKTCPYVQNKTDNVRITWHWAAFVSHLLPSRGNKYYIFWVCFCSLRCPPCNAHALYYIVICSLSVSTRFFHIYHKRHDFREKVTEYKMCLVFGFSVQLLSETFLILRRIEWDMIINVQTSLRKVPVILVRF